MLLYIGTQRGIQPNIWNAGVVKQGWRTADYKRSINGTFKRCEWTSSADTAGKGHCYDRAKRPPVCNRVEYGLLHIGVKNGRLVADDERPGLRPFSHALVYG